MYRGFGTPESAGRSIMLPLTNV